MSQDITKAVAYISYIVRAHTTTSLLYSLAETLDLEIDEIDVITFLPDPIPKDLITLEKKLLVIHLKGYNDSPDDHFINDIDTSWLDDDDDTDSRLSLIHI